MVHFDSRSAALHALSVLEHRLTRAPHEILMIRRDSSNSEACAAFVELSAIYHPRRFAEFGVALLQRSERAHRQLREALRAFASTDRTNYARSSTGMTRSR